MFRKQFLDDIQAKYITGIINEDVSFNNKASICALRTLALTKPTYLRRVHDNSIVTSKDSFKRFRS